MSNVDEAANVIDAALPVGSHITKVFGESAAQALADAGLLAPNLPQPDYTSADGKSSWDLTCKAFVDSWHPAGSPMVFLGSDGKLGLTPTEARKLAHMLLAAADYAQ